MMGRRWIGARKGVQVEEPGFAEFEYEPTSVVTTAIHAGHELPEDAQREIELPEDVRLREEDPHTDRLADIGAARIVCHRSRFSVDVNRERDHAVYRTPGEAWGLEVWSDPDGPPEGVVRRSLEAYERFYERAEAFLRRIQRQRGRFVVLDIHSYNHRRDGPDAPPADPEGYPEVNVGTGSLDRARWEPVVEAFRSAMSRPLDGERLDVRENVCFRGGHFVRWINETFAGTGCGLAIEFKKTFMDEWTGRVDEDRLEQLRRALARAAGAVAEELEGRSVGA